MLIVYWRCEGRLTKSINLAGTCLFLTGLVEIIDGGTVADEVGEEDVAGEELSGKVDWTPEVSGDEGRTILWLLVSKGWEVCEAGLRISAKKSNLGVGNKELEMEEEEEV